MSKFFIILFRFGHTSWLENNAMVANEKKTKSMIIASKPKVKMANKFELSLQDERLDEVTHFHYLGVRVNNLGIRMWPN